MIFGRNWPLSLDQITKRQSSLKVCFVFLPKSPIRARLIGQIQFLKMLKANLPKSGNKPKNSANCEHSIFDLGDVGPSTSSIEISCRCVVYSNDDRTFTCPQTLVSFYCFIYHLQLLFSKWKRSPSAPIASLTSRTTASENSRGRFNATVDT